VDGGIYAKFGCHANLVRREELLGIFFDCSAQALADDAPQDFSYRDWSDSTFWLSQSEEFGARKVLGQILWSVALRK